MSENENEQPDEPTETPQEDADGQDETGTAPEPSEEPTEPQEPEQEPEQPAKPEPAAQTSGLTQAEAEAIMKACETDWVRFSERTIKRWKGEGKHLRDCPLCFDTHKGLVDVRDAGQYPRELVNSVMAFLSLAREIDYKQSQAHNPCSFCDANGKVATGSQVPEFTTVTCPECHGFGYTPPPTAGGNGAGNGAAPLGNNVEPVTDIPQGEIDNWGEPRTLPDGRVNPNFGKQPSFKIPVEPYGITAGLSSRELVDA